MTFVIHKEPFAPRIITIGQGSTLAPEPKAKSKEKKNMAEEKKMGHETGVEVTRQDKASTQGAIASHGENAPAQEKVPQGQGKKEEKKDAE